MIKVGLFQRAFEGAPEAQITGRGIARTRVDHTPPARGGRVRLAAGLALAWVTGGAALAVPVQQEVGVPIVYAARSLDAAIPSGLPGRSSALAHASSGRLVLRAVDGTRVNLVDSQSAAARPGDPTDVLDPDVHWSGQRIVFAGFSPAEQHWRIYEINADGTGLRQVTPPERSTDLARYGSAASAFEGFDDSDPCYLPDGRICFVSTRYPGFAPGNRLRATNLHVINADGTGIHRITSERFGADTPTVDPSSGRVVYSRWWLTARETPPPSGGDAGIRPPVYYGPVVNANNFSATVLRGIEDDNLSGVNNWFIASVNPDGSGLVSEASFGLNRELNMAYRPTYLADGTLVTQFIRQSPVIGIPSANGIRALGDFGALPVELGGPQSFVGDARITNPNPASGPGTPVSPNFLYSGFQELPSGDWIVSGSPMERGEGQNQGLYLQTAPGIRPSLVVDAQDESEVDPVALVARPTPPVIADQGGSLAGYDESPLTVDEAMRRGGTFRFKLENLFANAPVGNRIATAPPAGRDYTIEFYMNPQREGTLRPEPPVLIGSRPIGPDGKVEMELPAGVPLLEILRRPDGKVAVGRDGQAFHVGGMNFGVAGREAKCVGCHAGHSQMEIPEDPSWTNLAPGASVSATSTLSSVQLGLTSFFQPAVLVDRLTDSLASEWASSNGEAGFPQSATVHLRWIQPIEARQITVHGISPGTGLLGARTLSLASFRLATSLRGEPVEDRRINATILPGGTRVEWNASLPFDELFVTLEGAAATGMYEGRTSLALAEIEVISRLVVGEQRTLHTRRGDVNCDDNLSATDAIVILDRLFREGPPFCCEDAADVSLDGLINLTDPIFLLTYLFRGGNPPVGAENCSAVTGSPFTCEQETCE